MKKIIFSFVCFCATAAWCGDAEVYDWAKGQYQNYSFSNNGREIYDWQNGNYLDVKPRGDGRFEVYDWSNQKNYDVKIRGR